MSHKKIEDLNTSLVLQEVKIDLVLKELKYYSTLIDIYSITQFRRLLKDLQHYKHSYNEIYKELQRESNPLSG